ncbi:MAG: hypothetical protein ACQ9ET_02660 [Nitrosomonadaceae bacterium]
MADSDVNIVGLDGVAPPMWATEQTLSEMLAAIENLVSISGKQRTEIKNALKSGSGSGGGSGGSGGDKKKKEAENLLGSLSKSLKNATGDVTDTAAGFHKLPGPMEKFAKGLKKTNVATYAMLAGIGAIANQATKAVVSIGEQVSTLRNLSDSGIMLENSFMEMSRGLAEVGMTIERFGEISSKYSRVMSMQGFKALSELSTVVNETGVGFAKWGMTQDEGIEIAAELLDQQRRAGIFRDIDNQRESKRIGDVMDRLTEYSKVLNVSRETMLASRKEMMSDAEVRFRTSQMTEAQRAKFESGLGGTATALSSLGEDFDWVAQLMKEAAVNQINEQSAAWQDLARAGFTPLANDLAALGDVAAETGVPVAMEDLLSVMKKYGNNKEFLESMFMAGGASKDYAIKIANATLTTEEAEDMKRRLAEKGASMEADAVDGNVQTMVRFQDKINHVMAALEHLRVDGFMTLIGGSAEGGLVMATEALDVMAKKMLEFSDGPALENFRDFIVDTPYAAAAVAIGGLVTTAAIWKGSVLGLSKATSGVSTLFGKMSGKLLGRLGLAGAAIFAVKKATDFYTDDEKRYTMTENWGRNLTAIQSLWSDDAAYRLEQMDKANEMSFQGNDTKRLATKRKIDTTSKKAEAQVKEAANATASQVTTEADTAEAATPTMSQADIAKLSVSERQAYLLAELLRTNKRIARGITGDSFA